MYITCNAVSTHLNHRRIFLFLTRWGVGSLLRIRNINYKLHWLVIYSTCLVYSIFFSIDRSKVRKRYDEYFLSSMQTITGTWQNAFSSPGPCKSIMLYILIRTKSVQSLVKILLRTLILKCSQGNLTSTMSKSQYDFDLWPVTLKINNSLDLDKY